MRIKYVNHLNEEIDLSKPPLMLEPLNAYDYAWDYSYIEAQRNGIKINGFYRAMKDASMTMIIHGVGDDGRGSLDGFNQALRLFFETVEKDIIANQPGKLVLNTGEYLSCYVVEVEHSSLAPRYRLDRREVKIISPYPFWITESTKTFLPIHDIPIVEDDLDYNYDYDHDYKREIPSFRRWNLDHFTSAEFRMIIYGYAENPRITINGHPYQVFGTIDENEYLVIDSRAKTVTHYLNNGTFENWFDNRNKEYSVFEPLPSGELVFTWDNSFGFDLLAYLERSEPRWT